MIRGYSFWYSREAELQEGIYQALTLAGLEFVEQARLTPKERLDFLVGGVAVELKVAGGTRPLEAQLTRYCRLDEVTGVVVVTTRVRHLALPRVIEGKPVELIGLAGAIL